MTAFDVLSYLTEVITTLGCSCDHNLNGYDCSLKKCPRGDDPLTTSQVNEVQILKCTSNKGSFTLYYNGVPSKTISHSANSATVTSALLSIPALTGLKVTFSLGSKSSVCSLTANVVSIEFTEQFGPQNPLVSVVDATLTAEGGSVVIIADGASSLSDAKGIYEYCDTFFPHHLCITLIDRSSSNICEGHQRKWRLREQRLMRHSRGDLQLLRHQW